VYRQAVPNSLIGNYGFPLTSATEALPQGASFPGELHQKHLAFLSSRPQSNWPSDMGLRMCSLGIDRSGMCYLFYPIGRYPYYCTPSVDGMHALAP